MFKVVQVHGNDLLKILRENEHPELPKCTRTILKSPKIVATEDKRGGDYIYLGIANGITRTLAANPAKKTYQ